MAERVSADEARRRVESNQALLVCGYTDDKKCQTYAIEGAIALPELEARLVSLRPDQELIFYCA